MRRKLIYIILAVTIVLASAVLIFFLKLRSNALTSPVTSIQPTPIVQEETETWTDPAQFSFQYPKVLTLNPHNEDEENYAHVELTSATHSGNLIIWVKDTKAADIEKWVTGEKLKNAIDTTLDGVPAKKILAATDSNIVTISAIQTGYLYQVEVNLAEPDFWNQTLEKVLSSFRFTLSEIEDKQVPAGNDTDSDASTIEEELIE